MSAGPIREWFDSWEPPKVSTTDKDRRCFVVAEGRGYCGRKVKGDRGVSEWADVVCADCRAAFRADKFAEVSS